MSRPLSDKRRGLISSCVHLLDKFRGSTSKGRAGGRGEPTAFTRQNAALTNQRGSHKPSTLTSHRPSRAPDSQEPRAFTQSDNNSLHSFLYQHIRAQLSSFAHSAGVEQTNAPPSNRPPRCQHRVPPLTPLFIPPLKISRCEERKEGSGQQNYTRLTSSFLLLFVRQVFLTHCKLL